MKTTSARTSELTGYLPSLDGWRTIAISIVLLFHSSDALTLALGPLAQIVGLHRELGGFGVDVFFAISGLLITSRLLSEEGKSGTLNLKSFYVRRAFRILPPSLIYLAIVAVLGTLGVITFNIKDWIAALLFYVNFLARPLWYVGHFWSLTVEEHYYAVWPAILLFVKSKRRLAIAIVLTIVIALWRAFNTSHIGVAHGFSYYSHATRTDFQVDSILWGAAAALFYQRYAEHRVVKRLLTPYVGLILACVVILSLAPVTDWKLNQALLELRSILIPVILLVTILNPRCIASSILELPLLRWVGKLSYSIYLWQQLFLVWDVQKFARIPLAQRFPFNIGCAFLCAICSYYLIEKPCIRIGHRLAKNFDPKSVVMSIRDPLPQATDQSA